TGPLEVGQIPGRAEQWVSVLVVTDRGAGLALQHSTSPGAGVTVRVGEVFDLSSRILVVAGGEDGGGIRLDEDLTGRQGGGRRCIRDRADCPRPALRGPR